MCTIHCLQSGSKLEANLDRVTYMSGTIRAAVEDVTRKDTIEIDAAISEETTQAVLRFIKAYWDATSIESRTEEEGQLRRPIWEGESNNIEAIPLRVVQTMAELHELVSGESTTSNWWNETSISAMVSMVGAASLLDIPILVTTIFTIVGKEISTHAEERMIASVVAPNGKLSIEGATESSNEQVAALALLVSNLRTAETTFLIQSTSEMSESDVQPSLVDGELSHILHRHSPNPAVYLNYLIEKKGLQMQSAEECVLEAHAARTGRHPNMFGTYSPEGAALTWTDAEKYSTPVPRLFVGDMIPKVQKQEHQDLDITKDASAVVSDLLAYAMDAVLALVGGANAQGRCDRAGCLYPSLSTVRTDRYLGIHHGFLPYEEGDDDTFITHTVLATRIIPRDEVYLLRCGEEGAIASWESRKEVIRVGLLSTIELFEEKSTKDQEALLKEKQEELAELAELETGNPERPEISERCILLRDIQNAVLRLLPGELCKLATKGIEKIDRKARRGYAESRRFGANISFDYNLDYELTCTLSSELTEEFDVHTLNAEICKMAGLQISVLEIAHAMTGASGKQPSAGAAIALASTIEYLAAELLELAGKEAASQHSSWIKPKHISFAIQKDAELNELFNRTAVLGGSIEPAAQSGYSTLQRVIAEACVDEEVAFENEIYQRHEFGDTFVCGTCADGDDVSCDSHFDVYNALSITADYMNRRFDPSYDDESDYHYKMMKTSQFATMSDSAEKMLLNSFDNARYQSMHSEIEQQNIRLAKTLAESTNYPATIAPYDNPSAGSMETKVPKKNRPRGFAEPHGHGMMILRDRITLFSRGHILGLAARAGCLILSRSVFGSIQDIATAYLKMMVGDAHRIMKHNRRTIVLATDILAIAADRTKTDSRVKVVCGTGRMSSIYARGHADGCINTPSALVKLAAKYSAALERAADTGSHRLDGCNESGFDEFETAMWGKNVDDEAAQEELDSYTQNSYTEGQYKDCARHPSGVPFLTKDEVESDLKRRYKDSIRYIRQMQRTSGLCTSFKHVSAKIHDMLYAYDFEEINYKFEPGALRLIQTMLETHLIELLQTDLRPSFRTFFNPIKYPRSLTITSRDLQLQLPREHCKYAGGRPLQNELRHELCAALAVSDDHEAALAASEAKAATLQQQLDALTTVTVINVETGEEEKKTLLPEAVLANQKKQREYVPKAAEATQKAAEEEKVIKEEMNDAREEAADQMDHAQTMINWSGRQVSAIDRLVQLATEAGCDPALINAAKKVC